MPRSSHSLLLALVTWLALPLGLTAQAPGYRGPDANQLRAEYKAEVIGQLNDLMAEWTEAWSADDLDRLSELYVEDATVFPVEGAPVRGLADIKNWLGGMLESTYQADAFLQDFDAAGGMAMGQSNLRIQLQSGADLTGHLMTILIRRGNRWAIRSQLFVVE